MQARITQIHEKIKLKQLQKKPNMRHKTQKSDLNLKL